MKRRWSVLFWISLGTLVTLSWLAESAGTSLFRLVSPSLIGLIVATGIAFVAMVKQASSKDPAQFVLVCLCPLAFECLQLLPRFMDVLAFQGPLFGVAMVGAFATLGTTIAILVMPPPKPPEPPPVPEVRVVD